MIKSLNSKNFFVSLITLIGVGFAYFQIDLPTTPDAIVEAGVGLSFTAYMTTVLIPNFLNPIIKIANNIKEGTFTWKFLINPNFIAQLITTLVLLINVATPLNEFWIITITNILNVLYNVIWTLAQPKPIPPVLSGI